MIEKLQKLARLEFSENEAAAIEQDLAQLLQFIEKINELDTESVIPLTHISDNVNNLRADEVQVLIERSDALKNAPKSNGEFFEVPKVIDK